MKKTLFPMLAKDGTAMVDGKVTSDFFDKKDWFAEIKYDGSRYILQRDEEGKVHLTSRNISVKDNLPVDKTENLRGYLYDDSIDMAGMVLDGEILIAQDGKLINSNGSSEVNRIMLSAPEKAKERLQQPGINVLYYVYDILYHKGVDIMEKSVEKRKIYLEDAIVKMDNAFSMMYSKNIKLVMPMPATQATYDRVSAEGYEGLILKQMGSPYVQGEHSKYRRKVKKFVTEDGIILGGNKGTGKYKQTLGALRVGQFFQLDEKTKGKYGKDLENVTVGHFLINNTNDMAGMILRKDKDTFFILKEVATISGMSDEQRNGYRAEMVIGKQNGKAVETEKSVNLDPENRKEAVVVEFLAQEKTNSRYRHPRFVQVRGDKPMTECLF